MHIFGVDGVYKCEQEILVYDGKALYTNGRTFRITQDFVIYEGKVLIKKCKTEQEADKEVRRLLSQK